MIETRRLKNVVIFIQTISLILVRCSFLFKLKIIANYCSRCGSIRFLERMESYPMRFVSLSGSELSNPSLYENHAEKNPFQWKQKSYPIWKLEWSDSDPVRWRHRIKRLDSNLKLYKYNTVNLLSCITLDIEYFHFAAHFKQQSLARVIESTISRS